MAAIAGIALPPVERRVKDPAVPLEFFKDRIFTIATIGGFLVSFALYGLIFAMSLYFQKVLSYTAAQTGWAFVPFALGITVSNVAGGWVSAKGGARLPIAGGLFLGAVGFVLLAGIGPNTSYMAMLPAQVLARFGAGLAVPPMTAALLSTVPRSRSGTASGLLNAIRQAGAAIGVAVFGALIRGDMIEGLRVAVIISAVLFAIAATAAAFGIRSVDRKGDAVPGTSTATAN